MRLYLLSALTMIAFAANSVFGRLGLGAGTATVAIDPAGYTLIRLCSGAIMLALLVVFSRKIAFANVLQQGNLASALALFGYAAAFSFAYVKLETGLGALILFACVQATMIGWSMALGNRPSLPETIGLLMAFGAFVWLVSPGLAAPDPLSATLMALSGISWGIYSVRGKGAIDPLQATAGNFIRATPIAIALMIVFFDQLKLTPFGIVMAIGSGAISSALGYSLWYEVLKGLTATKAAIVQLSVPVIAGFGGLILLSEPITSRFVIASVFILGGVAIAIFARSQTKQTAK